MLNQAQSFVTRHAIACSAFLFILLVPAASQTTLTSTPASGTPTSSGSGGGTIAFESQAIAYEALQELGCEISSEVQKRGMLIQTKPKSLTANTQTI